MATPGGGSLRVYDRNLLDEVLGSPKVRAGAAKPPRRARRCIRDSSSRFRDPQYPPTRPSPPDRSTDPRSPNSSPQNLSREPSKLRRSYDEDAAFAVGDEDLSSEDGSDAEEEATTNVVVRDADDEFAVRDDDDGDEVDGQTTSPQSEDGDDAREDDDDDDDDAASDATSVSNDERSEKSSATDGASEDGASEETAARSDAESDPRVAAGVGLTKEQLLRKKTAEENARRFFQSEELRESVFRRKAAAASRANATFERLLSDVEAGMGPDGVVARSDDLVYRREEARAKKHAEIHEEWEERIFQKLQRQIKTHVDAVDAEDLSVSLRRNAREYVETVSRKQRGNPKAGVFLDTTLGYEYDPAARAAERTKTAFIDSLLDPTKRDVYKPVRERIEAGKIIHRAAALDDARASTKETLAFAFWNNLEYTPHGRYTDADGELLPSDAAIPGFFTQGKERWNQHSAGNVRDDYVFPTGAEGDAEARREYFLAQRNGARKKRTTFNAAPEDVDGGTRTTLGLVNQTDMQTQGSRFGAQGATGGDAFLQRRGLGKPRDGFVPGTSPTRPDLFGVMNQEGLRDAYPRGDKDDLLSKGHRGDAWYARRGKACFEELAVQKSTRKGLYHVMQGGGTYADSGNPAGQNVGDAWLDRKLKDPVFSVDGLRYGSRYSGDAQGDLYGQLSHTHTLSEHPTKQIVDPPDPMFERMQRLNAGDESRRSRRHVQQYVTQL